MAAISEAKANGAWKPITSSIDDTKASAAAKADPSPALAFKTSTGPGPSFQLAFDDSVLTRVPYRVGSFPDTPAGIASYQTRGGFSRDALGSNATPTAPAAAEEARLSAAFSEAKAIGDAAIASYPFDVVDDADVPSDAHIQTMKDERRANKGKIAAMRHEIAEVAAKNKKTLTALRRSEAEGKELADLVAKLPNAAAAAAPGPRQPRPIESVAADTKALLNRRELDTILKAEVATFMNPDGSMKPIRDSDGKVLLEFPSTVPVPAAAAAEPMCHTESVTAAQSAARVQEATNRLKQLKEQKAGMTDAEYNALVKAETAQIPPTPTPANDAWKMNDELKGQDFKFTPLQMESIAKARTKFIGMEQVKKARKGKDPPSVKRISKHAMIIDGNQFAKRGQLIQFDDDSDEPFVFPDDCQEEEEAPLSEEDARERKAMEQSVLQAMQDAASLKAYEPKTQTAKGSLNAGQIKAQKAIRNEQLRKQAEEIAFLKAKIAGFSAKSDEKKAQLAATGGFNVYHTNAEGKNVPPAPGDRAQFEVPFDNGCGLVVSYIHLAGEEDKIMLHRLMRAHKDQTLRILYCPVPGQKTDDNTLLTCIRMAGNDMAGQNLRRYIISKAKNPSDLEGTKWLRTLSNTPARVQGIAELAPEDKALITKEAEKKNWESYRAARYMWDQAQSFDPNDSGNGLIKMDKGPLLDAFDKLEEQRAKAKKHASSAGKPKSAAAASAQSPAEAPKLPRKLRREMAVAKKQAAAVKASKVAPTAAERAASAEAVGNILAPSADTKMAPVKE